jgi:MFS family permease
MSSSLRLRLCTMMFLQYAIWGVWAPILGLHLLGLESFAKSLTWVGLVYMTMPIASIIAPFIGGQIADRWFATQRFLAVSQFLGGILLLIVARLTGHVEIFVGMLLYTLVYAPTIALTNSMVFHHWPNEQFSKIRMWGSIGWIVIGWVLAVWLGLADGLIEQLSPALKQSIAAWRQGLAHKPAMVDCLYIAAILSFIYAVFCLTLPHTPPSKKPERPWAILDALGLMRNPAFAVMATVAFFVGIELNFYFIWTQSFLNEAGGPFDAPQIKSVIAADFQGGLTGDVSRAADVYVSEMIAQADKNGDAKLSRAELGAIAPTNLAAKTFLESQDRALHGKGGLGLDQMWVSPVLTIGQICEMVMMAFLPLILRVAGFRWTIALGIAAWALRDFVLALGRPPGLVIGAVSLHGVGFALFCTAIFIFADAIAPKDIKASAQSFLASVTFGMGMLVGALMQGPVATYFNGDWHKAYLVPAILCAVCCVVFLIGFRPPKQPAPAAAEAPATA